MIEISVLKLSLESCRIQLSQETLTTIATEVKSILTTTIEITLTIDYLIIQNNNLTKLSQFHVLRTELRSLIALLGEIENLLLCTLEQNNLKMKKQ